jgi:hypothetical protein
VTIFLHFCFSGLHLCFCKLFLYSMRWYMRLGNQSSRIVLRKLVRTQVGGLRIWASICALGLAAALLSCSGAERPANKRSGNTSSSVYVFGTASFPVSGGGSISAEGDFNGDGRPDLAAVNTQNNSVAILLDRKDSTLLDSGANYPVGVRPQAIAVADFNGDGKPDLAITNHVNPIDSSSPGTFSILLGNGDGTFQTHTDHAAGSGVGTLVATDFNNDGKLDLVIANTPTATSSAVLLMLGNGDGSFQKPTTLSISGTPVAFATGDFNRDGNADLAVTTGASVVSVLLGNGNGSF